MSTVTFKAHDYISWKEGTAPDDVIHYGQINSFTGSSGSETYVIQDYESDEGTTVSGTISAKFTGLKHSQWARMKMRAKPNFRELAENVAFSSVYHPLIAKNQLFGPENVSFLIADALHEYVTKGLSEQMLDMLKPTALTKDSDAFFLMSDITDAMRKIPFVVILQQTVQKLMYKKQWGHQFLSNFLGGASVLYVSNVSDRMFMADSAKNPAYRYP